MGLRTAFNVSHAMDLDDNNEGVAQRAFNVGGTGYSIDAIELNPASWKHHFGSDRYEELEKVKKTYDPLNIFAPGQFVFPDPHSHCFSLSSSSSSSALSSSSPFSSFVFFVFFALFV